MAETFHWRVILRISESKSEEILIDAQRITIEDGLVIFWIGSELTGMVSRADLICCKVDFVMGGI
jgi:hypothetical protein